MDNPAKKKYRPFPKGEKRADGKGLDLVDIEKIKEMYVSGQSYRWHDFCIANNFNPASRVYPWFRERVNWEAWKREWVRRRNAVTEEEITPELLNCTKMIAKERIKYVQDWSSISKNMKALLTHLLNEHILNAAHDQQNAFTIRQGVGQKKLKFTIDELSEFAAAGNRIAELEARALMIVGGQGQQQIKPVEIDDDDTEEEEEKLPEFEVHTIGESMTANDRTRMLAEYFDQFQKPQEALPAPPGGNNDDKMPVLPSADCEEAEEE